MKNRTTLALLVLFFGSLLGLWFAELARVPTPEELRRRSARVLPELLDVPAEEIDRVSIEGGPTRLDFRRKGEAWQMVEPVEAPADPSRLEALVRALKAMPRPAGARSLEGDPRDYGLEPPVRKIRLYRAGQPEPLATLEVGKTIGDGRYVRPADHPEVEVVDALPLASVDRPDHEWRDPSLFRIPGFDVDELLIVGGGRTVRAEREGNIWRLREPIDAPGNSPRIESLLAGITSLRVAGGAAGYVADGLTDFTPYGLDPPTWRITLRSGGERRGREDVLLIGNTVPDHPGEFYARRGDADSVVAIRGRGLGHLADDPHLLRSRRVAVLDPSKVVRIRTESRGVVQEIRREGEGWRLVEPLEAEADAGLVLGLIAELNALETADLLEVGKGPEPGLDHPSAVLSVWEGEAEGSPDLRLILGNRNAVARTLYARTEGDPAILTLPIDALEERFGDPLAFVDHQMTSGAGPSRGLTLRRGGQTFRLVGPPVAPRDYARWRMVEPVEAEVDAEAVRLLDALLGNVVADRIVAMDTPDLDRFGLTEPWAVLEQETAPGVQPAPALIVGAELPGGGGARYARIEGRPLVFTLAPSFVAVLDREPHARRIFSFSPEQVERLVIRRGDRAQTLLHTPRPFTGGLEWLPDRGTDASDLDLPALDLLVAALGRLETPRFLQYAGEFPADSGLGAPALELRMDLRGGLGSRRLRIGLPAGPDARAATAADDGAGPIFLIPTGPESPWTRLLPESPEPPRPEGELPSNPFAVDPPRS